MWNVSRCVTALAIVAAAGVIGHADDTPTSKAAAVQLQLAKIFFDDGRFVESLDAYGKAVNASDPAARRTARIGLIYSLLRVAEFDRARREAEALMAGDRRDLESMCLYGDALWAAGLFDESEAQFREALGLDPDSSRARHGNGRAMAAKNRLDEAADEVRAAIRLAPRDSELHHTLGVIYERMHRYEQAAASYTNYVNLMPQKDNTDKTVWVRAQIQFLRSFGERQPFRMAPGAQDRTYTVGFRVVNDKVVVRAKFNNAREQDIVLDTGSESTIVSERTARDLRIAPITYALSAGVGEIGFRGLQLARLDSFQIGGLKLHNVPCLIKNPPLNNLPTREMESFSPLALGFSMTIDYGRHQLIIGREAAPERADLEMPLRLHRLATVRGTVDGSYPANFVVDTGGQVISISQATASQLTSAAGTTRRRIPLKVYGTSGWDRGAFLLPGVDLTFSTIQYRNFPVVVLNLDAPSALLGFQLGGIVGHKFLSQYRVALDLDRSVMRLTKKRS